jgi:hypothetical protein
MTKSTRWSGGRRPTTEAIGGTLAAFIGFSALIGLPAAAEGGSSAVRSECEHGVLDAGQGGMNVLVYELCAERLTIGFRSSDVIEELSCGPNNGIRLWVSAGDDRCAAQPPTDPEQVYDLLEPLRGVGRVTTAPLRKQLTCRSGTMNRASIVVPDARAALLETRAGDTTYEQVTRRFISQCRRSEVHVEKHPWRTATKSPNSASRKNSFSGIFVTGLENAP